VISKFKLHTCSDIEEKFVGIFILTLTVIENVDFALIVYVSVSNQTFDQTEEIWSFPYSFVYFILYFYIFIYAAT
jgi:hypothetical protein